ncbi:MAG: DnaD domain protein [Chloroflexi bacterium]|nr:DnaD domain protein [Chloroflexota bacterium]
MSPFNGFIGTKTKTTPVPAGFFSDLLQEIDDLTELKLILYAFWFLDKQEGDLRYLVRDDFLGDAVISQVFGKSPRATREKLEMTLEKVIRRNVLLKTRVGEEDYFFLNSVRGKAALQGLEKGSWSPDSVNRPSTKVESHRPNVYGLYEQNIGPLTPIIADALMEAEKLYSEDWINDAVTIAITKNVRNWRFIEAILRSWKEKGRDEKDQRSFKENRKRDSEGEFGDYIIH